MEFNPLEPATLSSEASEVIDFLVKYYQNIEKYPVRSKVEPNYLRNYIPESVPTLPESLENILKDIEKNIIPGLTHWQSPNFYAYFQATTSNAGLLGEILCTGFNVVGFTWISSPAATELEAIVMDWMGTLLQLPTYFLFSGGGGGVMLGSTSEAVMCTLSAARDRALNLHGEDKMTKLVVYASDHTHLCFQKSAKLVGIFPRNFRVLRTSSASDFALSSDELRETIDYDKSQGLIPIYICASVGTTSSNAVDPLDKIGKVAREYGVWLHVDAAYAGSACICPEYRHYLDGVEYADSFSMSPHKWLLTHLNSCCLWLKNPTTLVDSLSTKPEYLKNKVSELGQAIDYKDWQISFGRRFESLKLWMVIRRYGSAKLMSHIRSDIELAKYFETLVNDDIRFELVVPRKFALVCFRLKPIGYYGDGNVMNQKLLEYVNSSGKAFMSHAVLGGVFTIRCAIGGSLTKKHNIDSLWTLIQEKVNAIMRNGANIA